MSQSVPDADELGSVEVSENSQHTLLTVDDGFAAVEVGLTPEAAYKLANALIHSARRVEAR